MLKAFLDLDVKSLDGRKLDMKSILLFLIMAILWTFLWGILYFVQGVHSIYVNILFSTMYIVLFLNGYWSDDKEASYEKEKAVLDGINTTLERLALATLGFALFINTAAKYSDDREVVFKTLKLLQLAFIISFLSLIYVSIPKKGIWTRYYRKTKQSLLNFAIYFFIAGVFILTSQLKKK